MDEEAKGAEQVEGGEEEDVIPSSQGEMFSSQSSTPDLLSSSRLIPILQPSQSASGAESDMLLQPRAGELLGSTPTKSEHGGSISPAEVRPDLSATPSEACLDVSDTQCETRVDLSDTPSGSAGLKRPLSDSPAATPPDKRRRSVVSADDSDVQFVEEVGPDVQVVYCSEEPGSAAEITPADSAAAESQASFHLRLSPTQSEEVSPVVPQVPPAPTETGEASEPATESAIASAEDPAAVPPADAATDAPADPAAPSAGPSAEQPAEESQPADEPADSSGSQGFQPPAESESTEVRLPHIQTPQVASSGDSASPPGGDTVFGHAQRLIEEQNRRQELQDRKPSSPPPPREVQPVTVDLEEPASITLEEDESPPTTRREKEPVSVTMEGEASAPTTGQAETPASVMLDSEKPAPVAGQKKPVPASGQAEQAATSEASVIEGEGLATRPAEEAKDATPPLTRKEEEEEEEGQGSVAGIQLGSQASGMSLLADWRSVMKSPGRSTETADDRPERTVDRDSEAAGPATQAEEQAKSKTEEGAKAKVEEEAKTKPEEEAMTKAKTDGEDEVAAKAKADASAGEKVPPSVRWTETEAMEVHETPEELGENPLPGESATEDPYRFHGTQSQETQPSRLRPALKRPKVSNKSTSTAVSTSPAGDAASASLLKLMANLSTEAKKLTSDGYGLVEMSLTWRKAGDDKDVVKAFSLDEHDSAALLRRITSSSFSSSGSSQLSTSTAGGYAGDVSSSKSSSGSGSSSVNKRQSTLSSVTLSTIEGRGARHSISSSVDALPAPGRRSIVSVQSFSPGSDDGVQEVPASPPRRVVPEFLSPDGRPPRPHGQPAAVSSLRSGLDDPSWPASQLPPGLASPPAATSTQAERSSGDERPAAAAAAGRLPASQGSGSGASHVTGSTPSPEIALQPPLSIGPTARPLTDREEDELSEHEQSGLAQRILKPDTPCFALWGADQTYYPGRLVSEGRADRWLVRFDDGTARQVPTDHILPVVNLWKGVSVFVRVSHQNVYESGIITGHRMTSGADAVEYIISLDSQREVQSAVPRSWLSLTRDQAAVIKEKRQPSLGQLAVGSPTRHLSLDNLVTGRRRAAGASGGRRLANFETSCSDSAADASMEGSSGTRRAGSAPVASRRKGAKGKAQPTGSKSKTTEPAKETAPASSTSAKETTSPAGGRGRRAAPERRSRAGKATSSPATPDKPTSASAGAQEGTSAAGSRSRRGSRPKRGSTPTAAGATTADSPAATPGGRGKKRVTTSTPTDEAAATAATPGGCRSKRGGDAPATKASVPASTPVSRSGRKRAAPTSPSSPEPGPTPSRRARVRSAAGSAQKRPEPATPVAGRRARKRLALTPAAEEEEEEAAVPPAGQEERTSTDDTSPDKAAPIQSLGEVPSTKSKLFAKHTFILTCVDPSSASAHPKKGRRQISPLFDKRHVIRHIEARGGHVLHEPTLSPAAVQRVRSQGDLLLISNGALRTAKYISCLAMGVPCVEFSWLTNSIKLAQCLPYEDYLLPAGYDAETGVVVEQLLGATPPPLARLRVLLAAEPDSEWGQVMAQVLAAAGATVKLDRQDPAAAKLPAPMDVVVAEADCPPAVLAWADGCSVPVVSGEWAIGSVMAHRKLAFDAREEFDYRFRRYPGVG